MTRWSLQALCLISTVLALCQVRARAYLVNPWTAREWASGFFTNKCHPIPKNMTLCYGIGYDQMRLPNLLNHESVDEAVQQSNIWNLLDKTKCHSDLRIFLCSLYAPVCLKEARERQIIKPCRSLCLVVKKNCLPRMLRFGYEWPDIARCEKFPDDKRSNLCIPPRVQQQKRIPTCRACDQAITFENIISSYCMANIVLKGKMKSHRINPSEYVFNIHKKRRYFRSLGLSSGMRRSIGGQLKRSGSCVCPQLAQARRHDKWLIMGRRDPTTGRINIVFLTQWQRRNRSFKKATRAIRKKKNVCGRNQYSFISNDDLSLPQRPIGRRDPINGRGRSQVDNQGYYESRHDDRNNVQLLEGPTQWAPPRLSGRRNDLLARPIDDLRPPSAAERPLVRPSQLQPPSRPQAPPQQPPTAPQTQLKSPPSLERPSQETPPSRDPLRSGPKGQAQIRQPEPKPTNHRPTTLSQPRPTNERVAVPPTVLEPTPQRGGKQRRKGRKKQRGGKKRDGKKRDGKKRKRKNKKQKGNKRRGNRKGGRRKGGKRRGDNGNGADRERKRKRKRKKKLRRSYFQQHYYGQAAAR